MKIKELKTNAELVLNIANDTVSLSQIIGNTLINLIKNEKKKLQIFNVDESYIKPELDGIFEKIKNVFTKISEEFKNKLYGETFNNPAKRLGNFDANFLIEKYLKKELKLPCSFEDNISVLLIKLENELEDLKKKSEKKPKNPPCRCFIL